jgi:hypothetical protein
VGVGDIMVEKMGVGMEGEERLTELEKYSLEFKKRGEERKARVKQGVAVFLAGNFCRSEPLTLVTGEGRNVLFKGVPLFLYESIPLDLWEGGWMEYRNAERVFFDLLKDRFREALRSLEKLLVRGIAEFPSLFSDFRGEPIRFAFIPSHSKESFIIAVKCDSNGTCYAWSELYINFKDYTLNENEEWRLVDCVGIKEVGEIKI